MSAEVLIVGGGLAGSAAAIDLARTGRSVVLLERGTKPEHKVCGEFLSTEALTMLHELSIDVSALGAVPIAHVRVAGRHKTSESTLPFAAMSLTRCVLDEALMQAAQAAGVTVKRGHHVETLHQHEGKWHASLRGADDIAAPAVFLATGKHDLRAHARPEGMQNDLVAFKMYFRVASPTVPFVDLILFPGGYAGMQPVERGMTNLCCVVRRSTLASLGNNWPVLLEHLRASCPHLNARLAGATPVLDRPLAISNIPYGYVRCMAEPGLWCLGDQAAVIPSFTGDGMSIALHSGRKAAEMYLAGASSLDFQQAMHRTVKSQVSLATAVSRLMVHPTGQKLAVGAVQVFPGIISALARRTRLRVVRH